MQYVRLLLVIGILEIASSFRSWFLPASVFRLTDIDGLCPLRIYVPMLCSHLHLGVERFLRSGILLFLIFVFGCIRFVLLLLSGLYSFDTYCGWILMVRRLEVFDFPLVLVLLFFLVLLLVFRILFLCVFLGFRSRRVLFLAGCLFSILSPVLFCMLSIASFRGGWI